MDEVWETADTPRYGWTDGWEARIPLGAHGSGVYMVRLGQDRTEQPG